MRMADFLDNMFGTVEGATSQASVFIAFLVTGVDQQAGCGRV